MILKLNASKRTGLLLAALMFFLSAAPAMAEQEKKEFAVGITWVHNSPVAPDNLSYDYFFVEKSSLESHQLHISAGDNKLPSLDARLTKAEATIPLPLRNAQDDSAVYGLSAEGLGFVEMGGTHYAVSSSESEDPSSGKPYFSRFRVLSQQMQPKVRVIFQGVAPQGFELTLRLESWATNEQGTGRVQHSAIRRVTSLPRDGVDLFQLFSQDDEAIMFRNFVLAELSWDGKQIAGENRFALEVAPLSGILTEIGGNAAEGFQILFSKAQ